MPLSQPLILLKRSPSQFLNLGFLQHFERAARAKTPGCNPGTRALPAPRHARDMPESSRPIPSSTHMPEASHPTPLKDAPGPRRPIPPSTHTHDAASSSYLTHAAEMPRRCRKVSYNISPGTGAPLTALDIAETLAVSKGQLGLRLRAATLEPGTQEPTLPRIAFYRTTVRRPRSSSSTFQPFQRGRCWGLIFTPLL